jgi:hypothetical protein
MRGSYEDGNEPSESIIGGRFLDKLRIKEEYPPHIEVRIANTGFGSELRNYNRMCSDRLPLSLS